MRKTRVAWAVALSMLASPLHCLSEELAKPSVPTLSISAQHQKAPVIGAKMCCHPTEGVLRSCSTEQSFKKAATASMLPASVVPGEQWIDQNAASQSPGPPGSRLLVLNHPILNVPLLI